MLSKVCALSSIAFSPNMLLRFIDRCLFNCLIEVLCFNISIFIFQNMVIYVVSNFFAITNNAAMNIFAPCSWCSMQEILPEICLETQVLGSET